MEKQHVKIQINSLQALERLIGGDSELELDLRNSIALEFANKHIKPGLKEKILGATIAAVEANFLEEIRGDNWNKQTVTGYKLNQKTKDLIIYEFTNIYYKQLDDIISVKFKELVKDLEQTIQKSAAFIEEQLTEAILTKKIDALVDKRIKEKLNLS